MFARVTYLLSGRDGLYGRSVLPVNLCVMGLDMADIRRWKSP